MRSIRNKLDKFSFYDIQFKFVLNPLNWEVGFERYKFKLIHISFGPVAIFVYYGDG